MKYLLGLFLCVAFNAHACKVKSFWWQTASYNNAVIQLHIDLTGCDRNRLDVKLYDGDEFLGGGFTFVKNNYAYIVVDVRRPVKKKDLQITSSIS